MNRILPPALDLFDPLARILVHDDFNRGMQGWTGLVGNYEDSLDSMLPEYADLRDPMLSNLTVWDTGTDGSLHGNYAMKLATLPRPGSLAVAIKRLTWRVATRIRWESIVTFKPEASELKLSSTDVRAFGILLDLQDDDLRTQPHRVMPHVRYLNADESERTEKWQYKSTHRTVHAIGGRGETKSHFHLGPDGWSDLPDGGQRLCYNEIATKHNWYYLRLDFDLRDMRYLEFQCNNRVYACRGVEPIRMPAMPNLWCMLNLAYFVETNSFKRAFLYVDSSLVSTDRE